MNDANGIGPVAVIASESCFARGVDHSRASDEDHLAPAPTALQFHRGALRKAVLACLEIMDLILAFSECYSFISDFRVVPPKS